MNSDDITQELAWSRAVTTLSAVVASSESKERLKNAIESCAQLGAVTSIEHACEVTEEILRLKTGGKELKKIAIRAVWTVWAYGPARDAAES